MQESLVGASICSGRHIVNKNVTRFARSIYGRGPNRNEEALHSKRHPFRGLGAPTNKISHEWQQYRQAKKNF